MKKIKPTSPVKNSLVRNKLLFGRNNKIKKKESTTTNNVDKLILGCCDTGYVTYTKQGNIKYMEGNINGTHW